MSVLLEKQFSLNENEKNFLNYVLSYNFPFFYQNSTLKHSAYVHTLVNRVYDDMGNDLEREGIVNSNHFGDVKNLFDRFCEEENISYTKIYRAAINSTHYSTEKYGDIHIDHNFPHLNFIMYLNEFSNGNTYIFDDDENLIEQIKPEKNKIAIFKGNKHAQGFCKPNERRVVLILTYI